MWAFLGGLLGLGSEASQSGQPIRSTPQIAAQIRQLYATWVQGLEDAFYLKMYKDRMEKMVAQGQQPQEQQAIMQQQQNQQPQQQSQPQVPPQQQPQQHQLQQQQQQQSAPSVTPRPPLTGGTQGMSAQFLDAVAKVPGATLTDQQKRALDEARRGSMSSATGLPTPAGQQQQLPTPTSGSFGSLPLQPNQPQQNQNASVTPKPFNPATMQANPALIYQWIKVREEAIKTKFRELACAH